ncbi:hypothetical protein PIB30_067265 [Stylosanthes scabra]|uniref:Uncharacterized protein n=1 Tax=Stylosanthes scabra TaxID=79078 RepID=A0ABU6VLI0_9FABA|nr:hypothetical protein [Stylosanthes scabra]
MPSAVVHRPLCCPVSIHRRVPRPFHSSSRHSAHHRPSSLLLRRSFLRDRRHRRLSAFTLRPSRSSSPARHLRPSGDRGSNRENSNIRSDPIRSVHSPNNDSKAKSQNCGPIKSPHQQLTCHL